MNVYNNGFWAKLNAQIITYWRLCLSGALTLQWRHDVAPVRWKCSKLFYVKITSWSNGIKDCSHLTTPSVMNKYNVIIIWVVLNINKRNPMTTLSGRIGKVLASHAEGCKIESRLWLSYSSCILRGAQGVLPRPPKVQACVYYAVRLIN